MRGKAEHLIAETRQCAILVGQGQSYAINKAVVKIK
jgi:hypothetical protein